jgi:hypothetical protein
MLVKPYGTDTPPTADVAAHDILSQLLMSLSPIWPAQNALGTVPLGDCWRHSAVRGDGPDRRVDALSQAVAVADLFAAGAV